MTAAISMPRLSLRLPDPGDAAAIAALVTPGVSRWTASWPDPTSPDFAAERCREKRATNAAGEAFTRIVERRNDGRLIGWLDIRLAGTAPGIGSLGYWLGEDFHGQGYLTEVLAPFVAAAVAALDLHRLEAGVQPANAASIAALKRLGMTFVEERMQFVPARDREERTGFYALLLHP